MVLAPAGGVSLGTVTAPVQCLGGAFDGAQFQVGVEAQVDQEGFHRIGNQVTRALRIQVVAQELTPVP